MKKRKTAHLGELELVILKVIWELQPCTVKDVAIILAEQRGSALTTVLTVMQRLHAKKFLRRRKHEGIFRYSTADTRSTVISRLVDQFVTRVLDGSAEPFVSYLAQNESLTPEQAETLRKMAEEIGRDSETRES